MLSYRWLTVPESVAATVASAVIAVVLVLAVVAEAVLAVVVVCAFDILERTVNAFETETDAVEARVDAATVVDKERVVAVLAAAVVLTMDVAAVDSEVEATAVVLVTAVAAVDASAVVDADEVVSKAAPDAAREVEVDATEVDSALVVAATDAASVVLAVAVVSTAALAALVSERAAEDVSHPRQANDEQPDRRFVPSVVWECAKGKDARRTMRSATRSLIGWDRPRSDG